MTNIEKIEDMLNKQDKLNCLTNGDEWKENITDSGRTIDWLRCIRREAMELMDSFPWEHWKSLDRKPDIDNALIETTDIWFFTMSYVLSITKYDNTIGKILNNALNIKTLTKDTDIPALAEGLVKTTYDNPLDMTYLIYKFVKIMNGLDMDLDLLYSLYNGKLVLNKFRQLNGYKEGTYVKVWNGKEDNVHMLEIIRANKDITDETLYNALINRYATLNK